MAFPSQRAYTKLGPGTASNAVVTKPTGTVDGDVIFVVLHVEHDTSITPPSGWALVGSPGFAEANATNQNFRAYVYWKRASSEGSDWTWTFASTFREAWAVTYQDVLGSGDPWSFIDIQVRDNATGRTYPDTSGTTTDNDELLIFFGGMYENPTGHTQPTGFTTRDDTAGSTLFLADKQQASAGATGTVTGGSYSGGNQGPTCGILIGLRPVSGNPTYEQEGFQFYNDNGDEDGSTGKGAQDSNVTHPLDTNLRLRVLVDTEVADPPSTQFRLDYKKSTDSVYIQVPLVYKVRPVIEAGDATATTIGTAADPWAINVPAAATGDLLIFIIAWDDSVDVTSVAAPTGPNGETISSIVGPQASANTEMRIQAWFTKATGSWSAGTVSFNPSASETCRAIVIKVLAGEFDPTTPIGASGSSASSATNESNINSPAFSAGASDGEGCLVIAFGSDTDAITVPASGTDTVNNATGGAVGLDVETRTAAVTDSESIAAITATIAGDSWATVAFVVRAPASPIYMSPSANIAASGEATTNRLSAPSGGGTFTAGRIQDDENPADAVDIANVDGFTELEWCMKASAPAVNGDIYQFRVTRNGTALDTYTLTPEWTIGTIAASYLETFRRALTDQPY